MTKSPLLLLIILFLGGCAHWPIAERERFIADCVVYFDRQTNNRYTDQQANLYCVCLQSETEVRYLPNAIPTLTDAVRALPEVVVNNCARKANIRRNIR